MDAGSRSGQRPLTRLGQSLFASIVRALAAHGGGRAIVGDSVLADALEPLLGFRPHRHWFRLARTAVFSAGELVYGGVGTVGTIYLLPEASHQAEDVGDTTPPLPFPNGALERARPPMMRARPTPVRAHASAELLGTFLTTAPTSNKGEPVAADSPHGARAPEGQSQEHARISPQRTPAASESSTHHRL